MAKKKQRVGKTTKNEQNAKNSVELNPFESKSNRSKLHIAGKSLKRHEKGFPGLSKLKSMEKRKTTLLKDYLQTKKSNKLIDKRIGENEQGLSLEDKMLARFAAERRSKKSDYGFLDEEVDLTHHGHKLTSIEKFDNPASDSEDEEARHGNEFVSKAHFGGFLVKKDEESSEKTRDMIIAEIVLKSKERKELRQKEKETSEVITDELDDKWKSVQALLASSRKKPNSEPDKADLGSYDFLVRELKFEARAKAGASLKSVDVDAKKKEKENAVLEGKLLKRMELFDPKNRKIDNHRSADDLDDDFDFGYNMKSSNTKVDQQSIMVEEDDDDDDDEEEKDKGESQVDDVDIEMNEEQILDSVSSFIRICKKEDALLYKKMLKDGGRSALEYLQNEISGDVLCLESKQETLSAAITAFYQQAAKSPITFAKVMIDLMKNNRSNFLKTSHKKLNGNEYLFEMIITFKIVGLLYPTSDFRHSVTTVALMFMSEALMKLNGNYPTHVFAGIYISHLLLEFTQLSKRHVPECFMYLSNLLTTTTTKLIYSSGFEKQYDDVIPTNGLLTVNSCISLLNKFLQNWQLSFYDPNLVESIKKCTEKLPSCSLPSYIMENVKLLSKQISDDNLCKRKKLTQANAQRLKIKLLAPRLLGKDHKDNKSADKILIKKHRKELKGAVREIRKDNQFLASQQLKEQRERDATNKRKMRELLQDIAEERGSFRKRPSKPL